MRIYTQLYHARVCPRCCAALSSFYDRAGKAKMVAAGESRCAVECVAPVRLGCRSQNVG